MSNRLNRKKFLIPFIFVTSMGLVGCSSDNDDEEAEVRVIHTSPDAPAVNVKLDGVTAISNLDYAESTGFAKIDAGVQDVVVEAIVPGGNLDVITVADLDFAEDTQTTIMAVNDTANIEPLIVSDSASTPAADEIAVNVVHASPAASALTATVDVYVTADGIIATVDPTFSFDFKESVDAGVLSAGEYHITVTTPGSKTPVYQSGAVDLAGFAGQKLLIAAIDTVNSTTQDATDGAPIKLLAVTASSTLELLDSSTLVGARVVHLSPDADAVAAGPVEVWANTTTELIPAFSYTGVVPGVDSYVSVAAADYIFDVAVDGAGPGTLYTSPAALTLVEGFEYTIIASGYVGMSPDFDLLATADNNRSIATQASIKVVHAAPSAGLVDVFVTPAGDFSTAEILNGDGGDPLLDEFAFNTVTDYVPVAVNTATTPTAPASYDIRVVAGGAVAIDTTLPLAGGDVVTVIAQEPNSAGAPTTFGTVVLSN